MVGNYYRNYEMKQERTYASSSAGSSWDTSSSSSFLNLLTIVEEAWADADSTADPADFIALPDFLTAADPADFNSTAVDFTFLSIAAVCGSVPSFFLAGFLAFLRQMEGMEELVKWRHRKKHIFLLTSAGKPIYSRYPFAKKLASVTGVLVGLISFVESRGGAIRSITAGKHKIVFLVKG